MNQSLSLKRSRARNRAIMFGALSVCLYAAVFTHADTVMTYTTKGHFFAVLPVATVFLFSYVHGSFASNLWTALGIEASHKATTSTSKSKSKAVRPQAKPRARVYST